MAAGFESPWLILHSGTGSVRNPSGCGVGGWRVCRSLSPGRPYGPERAAGGRDGAPPTPPTREEGAAQAAAAARRGGARAGTRAGPGAGTPGSRSPGGEASGQASREDREGGAEPERAEPPPKCDAPARLGRAAGGRPARRGGRAPGSCAAPGGAEGQPQQAAAAAGPGGDPSEPHAPRGLTGRSPHGAAGPDRSR